MKKILSMIVALGIATTVFTACSKSASSNATTSSVESTSSEQTTASADAYSSFSNETPSYSIGIDDADSIGIDDAETNEDELGKLSSSFNSSNIEEESELEDLSDDELETLEQKQEDLYADLADAFKKEGIAVTINKENGEIAMNSTVLFGGDSAELSNDGKSFLNKFMKAYTSIVYSEKYKGFIKKTMVEGHIAPISGTTYEGGMPLSEKRAKNVKKYCASVKTTVDSSKIENDFKPVGYSNSKPILNDDGTPNMNASRRVSFKFIINVKG